MVPLENFCHVVPLKTYPLDGVVKKMASLALGDKNDQLLPEYVAISIKISMYTSLPIFT